MGEDEKASNSSRRGEEQITTTKYITSLYDRLVEIGYLYTDLYNMTLTELENTLVSRRKGIGYEIWRLASLTHHPMIKNFPSAPEEACPELYPIKKGIKMPDFLIEKAIKQGALK